jgi:uncharacterized membrane protein
MFGLTTYTALMFVHVLSAIVAVGFNASYGVWIALAAKDPEHEAFVLRGVKRLDSRFANPAYALLLVTGLSMAWVGHLDLTTFWLAAGLTLYVGAAVGGITVYGPLFRRQVALLEAGKRDTPEYAALAKRGTAIGVALVVDVVAIVFLMVTKPTL